MQDDVGGEREAHKENKSLNLKVISICQDNAVRSF